MIALRSAMFAGKKSSAPTARDYVQDGLVAMEQEMLKSKKMLDGGTT